MTKKHLILLSLLALTLTLVLSGCGKSQENLDGMYIVEFQLNGGKLDIQSSDVNTKIYYAYEPGSHILDPSTYGNYELSRSGYYFTGWYTSEECREEDKWDFTTDTIEKESITLYAGWIKAIVYTYSVCYMDGEEIVKLGSYTVDAGKVFEDYRKIANKRDGFTANGYYSDPACTVAWDFNSVHPGGETDTDICVYVDYIPGEWKLVDSYTKLLSAMGQGNIYLTADIDCGGQELFFSGTFAHVFEGNGYSISNFTVNKSGSTLIPCASVFQSLGDGSVIRNVSFENVTFNFFDVDNASKIKVAALAKDATGATVSNVSVTGTFFTNYQGEFPRLTEAFYDEVSTADVTDFVADIIVEKQN